MVFDVRAATIEGEPQEMAEFVMAIERLQTEEAVREWESMMAEKAQAEPYFEPELLDDVLLKDGEVVFILKVDLDEEVAEVAKVGEGTTTYKLVGFEDIVRLATENERDEQYFKNRGV